MQSLIILTAFGRLASDPLIWEVPMPIRFDLPNKTLVKSFEFSDNLPPEKRVICKFEFTGKYQVIIDKATTKSTTAAIYAFTDVDIQQFSTI